MYQPGTFTPLLRVETATDELTKALRRTLAEKLQRDVGVAFVPELVTMLDNLKLKLRRDRPGEHSQLWLNQYGRTPEQKKNLMEPAYTSERKLHLYHCDHRGLPLASVDTHTHIFWQAEFDEWGNLLWEDDPGNLQQLSRLPGQQHDAEKGCIITGTGITTRSRDGILRRAQLG